MLDLPVTANWEEDTERIDSGEFCENCGTELYMDEIDDENFQGYCEDCDWELRTIKPIKAKTKVQINKSKGDTTMNKFKAFNPNTPKEEVYFKLVTMGNGVQLMAVKGDGTTYPSGCILTILNDGRIQRATAVSQTLGLSLDTNRRVNFI
jgi:DNA-directed RNA polymerase subunit M/transcription elongation factor TFIIS